MKMADMVIRNLQWAVVCIVFWAATVTFRLAYASDVTDWAVWWTTLLVGPFFLIMVGYNLASWRFYSRTHSIALPEESDTEDTELNDR